MDTSGNGNAFVEDRLQGRETVEGKTEARRTRRLDLGQREQSNLSRCVCLAAKGTTKCGLRTPIGATGGRGVQGHPFAALVWR